MTAALADLDLLGAPLFLLRDRTDGPIKGRYAAPRGWQHTTADTNDDVLDGYAPGCGVAMVCGQVFDVIDVDPRNGGKGSLASMIRDGLVPVVLHVVTTPSGGWHLYVEPLGVGKFNPLPGIDVQAGGAFVLVPPSEGYEWLPADEWPTSGAADGAERLRALARSKTPADATPTPTAEATPQALDKARAVLDKAVREVGVSEGSRNNTVSRWLLPLFRFVKGGALDRDDVEDRMWAAVPDSDHPYTRDEFEASCQSAWAKATPDLPRLDGPTEGFGPMPDRAVPSGESADLFPRTDLGELLRADRPPREWVLTGLIPAGASVSLVSPAGVGKSLLALALSLAVARGDETFAGLQIPRERRVLYFDQENTLYDVAERLEALGVREDVPALAYLSLTPLGALDTEAGGVQLAEVVDRYGLRPGDMVVLDSTQRVIDGPENDSDTQRAFYRHTALELKRRGVTVLRLDNTGKDPARGARGTSAKRDDVDFELVMTRDKTDPEHLFNIAVEKNRIPDIHPISLGREEDDAGVLRFTTAGDPYRRELAACLADLADRDIPTSAGVDRVWSEVKDGQFTRSLVRAAVRERKTFGATP